MNILSERSISCPYCGEDIDILVDESVPDQSYIEDCQVCCRPINFEIAEGVDGDFRLSVSADTD